jgi:hypothetical protein
VDKEHGMCWAMVDNLKSFDSPAEEVVVELLEPAAKGRDRKLLSFKDKYKVAQR